MSMIINPYAFGFNPLSIAGCKLWLRADTITGLTDGQALTTWLDESGLGNNATQATAAAKPLYKTNIQNGRPVVRFDGVNDFLSVSGNPIARTQTEFAYFAVAKINTAGSNRTILDITESTDFSSILLRNIYLSSTGQLETRVRDDANSSNASTAAEVLAVFKVVSGTRNGNAVEQFRNGSSDGVSSENAIGAMDLGSFYTTVGALRNSSNPNGASFHLGDIAEILIYNTALSTANRQAVEAYLNAKWAVY